VRISSISAEIGAALHSATSTRRADSPTGGPAISADNAIRWSEQVVNGATLGTAKASSKQAEAGEAVAPVINSLGQGFKFLVQGLKFSVDEETGREIIKVVDIESGKLIRQIPTEEALNFSRQLEGRKGILLSIKS
jgi:uncharacterized FlaG/YvyC family protein